MIQELPYFIYKKRGHWLPSPTFPPLAYADRDGFLAAGGSFSPDVLWQAYCHGIFPWPYSEADTIYWFAPPERFVLYPEQLHLSHSLRRTLRKHKFELRVDTAFSKVMENCMLSPRPADEGSPNSEKTISSWIQPQMIEHYTTLHRMGIAHSIEAWLDGCLVGGLYGLNVGSIFCGESMFTIVPDATKCAFATFAKVGFANGIRLIDCQARTNNMARYGADNIPRDLFMAHLDAWKTEQIDWLMLKNKIENIPVDFWH
ncbi:MAG: leucyl/phenylalanyl-tRNA--protein transferase [Proteobacteria bacterium]|jgi:leucyl/phenylalanyl-tRNA--protein transferase|nr:leucyl/phenylalanyl-tRNA--protein transferase [Pseudomonadota bacterium]